MYPLFFSDGFILWLQVHGGRKQSTYNGWLCVQFSLLVYFDILDLLVWREYNALRPTSFLNLLLQWFLKKWKKERVKKVSVWKATNMQHSKKLNPWHLSYEFENVTGASLERHKALHLSAAEACIPCGTILPLGSGR